VYHWEFVFELPTAAQDGAVTLNGSHSMWGRADFSKNLSATLFKDDLSNEPNFGWIHLAGLYL
jgi:hypothetical protein